MKERRIPYEDLTLLAFQCQRCKGELTFDVTQDAQVEGLQAHAGKGESFTCPFCGRIFKLPLQEALILFRTWRGNVKNSGYEIVFRIQERTEPTEQNVSDERRA